MFYDRMTKENEQLVGSLFRALKAGDKRERYRNRAGEAMRKLQRKEPDQYTHIPPGWDGQPWKPWGED